MSLEARTETPPTVILRVRMRCLTSGALHGKSFDDNIDILFDEILLAEQWGRPSLLLAVHKSKFGQDKAEKILEKRLVQEGFQIHRIVFNDERSDIAQLIRESGATPKSVFFISNLDWGGGREGRQAYRGLNLHRELFVEEAIKAVFWLTVNEAGESAALRAGLLGISPPRGGVRQSARGRERCNLPAGILAWDMPQSPDPFESPQGGIQARGGTAWQAPGKHGGALDADRPAGRHWAPTLDAGRTGAGHAAPGSRSGPGGGP